MSRTATDELFRLQYTAEASEFYRRKMMRLIGNDPARRCELKGYVPDGRGGMLVDLPGTLMYRIDTLAGADGHRLYEFLIEYDVDSPTEGIYYGCRGITVDGFNHAEEIRQFRAERETVLPEMCQILNNTFPQKDFSYRFKLTDNADNNTYWLFWITLKEEEDIQKVGVTATTIIRNVFRRYLHGEPLRQTALPCKHFKDEETVFTNASYDALLQSIRSVNGAKKVDVQKTAEARALFEKFILGAEHQRILAKDPNYELAWRFMRKDRVDFARMVYAFFLFLYRCELINTAYRTEETEEKIQVPWTAVVKVFLDKDGNAYRPFIRTQLSKRKSLEEENKLIREWIITIQNCIEN